MTRQLTRSMEVNLDQFARRTLMRDRQPNEDLLEVYRWIAVTASEHGRKWEHGGDTGCRRYPNIRYELGVASTQALELGPHPLTYHEFSLCFTHSSSEYMAKIRQVITRLAFGMHYDIRRWRHDHGLLRCHVPCRVLRAKGWLRDRDPLAGVYFDRPSCEGAPIIRGRPQISVSFNEIHPQARGPHYFMLVPEESGWRLAVVYCYPDGSSMWLASADQDGRPLVDQIPTQGRKESANEFFMRCRDYARSILVSEPQE